MCKCLCVCEVLINKDFHSQPCYFSVEVKAAAFVTNNAPCHGPNSLRKARVLYHIMYVHNRKNLTCFQDNSLWTWSFSSMCWSEIPFSLGIIDTIVFITHISAQSASALFTVALIHVLIIRVCSVFSPSSIISPGWITERQLLSINSPKWFSYLVCKHRSPH